VDILDGSEQDDIRIMETCVRICNGTYFLVYDLHYIYYDGYTIFIKEIKPRHAQRDICIPTNSKDKVGWFENTIAAGADFNHFRLSCHRTTDIPTGSILALGVRTRLSNFSAGFCA
jgi:hypothetical protein